MFMPSFLHFYYADDLGKKITPKVFGSFRYGYNTSLFLLLVGCLENEATEQMIK